MDAANATADARLDELIKMRKELNNLSRSAGAPDLQKRFDAVRRLLADRTKQLNDLRARVLDPRSPSYTSSLQKQLDAVRHLLADRTKQLASQMETLEDLRASKAELQKQLDLANASVADARLRSNALKQVQNELQLEVKEQKNLVKSLKSANDDLEEQLSSLNNAPSSPEISNAQQGLKDEWLNVQPYFSVQQVRFCQILKDYSGKAAVAKKSRNQLMQNSVVVERDNDIAALLPGGNYKDWVAKLVEVYATPSGDAAFVLRLPCETTLGSGRVESKRNIEGAYAATASSGGLIYNQLAQLSMGDTVLISGKLLTYRDIGMVNKRLNFVTTFESGEAQEKIKPEMSQTAPDYFSSIEYLSKL